MAWTSSTRARAKINLTLHIRGRLENGYHDLESLVAFAECGDKVTLVAGDRLSLSIKGPEAGRLAETQDNHILKAAEALSRLKPGLRFGHFELIKRLPVTSGMGGGSADAAAALRLLARLNDLQPDDPALYHAAIETGADVPVCLESRSRMMRGIGDDLGEPLVLPRLHAVLVNPRMGSSTPAVFQAIGLERGALSQAGPHPVIASGVMTENLLYDLRVARNDMEAAAKTLLPVIGDVREAIESLAACRLVRMSGSGATFFGLFDTCRAATHAAKILRHRFPDWWINPTLIR